jgi:hypothetical protein
VISARASPRSCPEGRARRQWAVQDIGRIWGFFRTKAQHFYANGGDTCGCRNPLEGAVVVTFVVLGLRVKTLDLAVSTTAAQALWYFWGRCQGASILLGFGLVSLVASPGSSCTCSFFISLIYFVRGSPHHFISVWPYGFIYKAERKPVSRRRNIVLFFQ